MTAFKGRVGVIGATSLIGECLLPLLIEEGWDVVAFTRRMKYQQGQVKTQPVDWQLLRKTASSNVSDILTPEKQISHWMCLAPIWVLPEYFPLLSLYGVQHVVAISSTSRFTKTESSDPSERALAAKLTEGEELFIDRAQKNKVAWTILRPTLIYGLRHDKNVSVIIHFIKRFAFFPLLGTARGLRQPVHAHDVALGCLAALSAEKAFNRSYNISGGETLPYREMVGRIFSALGRKSRFVTFPLWLFRLAVLLLRMFPPFRHWSTAMAERMNQDLVFDHEDACRDLGFSPRPFLLTREDLPG
jgi:NAD dependent epimerase/dehydratase family.